MTAQVSIADRRLSIRRRGVARWVGAAVDVPLAHVVSVTPADPHDVRRVNKGIRLAGFQIPGLMTSGLYRQGGRLTWWDVGRGDTAIVITLRDERWASVVVEVDDPLALMGALHDAVARAVAASRAAPP